MAAPTALPTINGRIDHALLDALKKVTPQARDKAKTNAQDFEATFLNSMFQQMLSGVEGEGPFGSTPGTGVWRSMLADEYAKNFSKAGGVGVSDDVFRTLIMQQAAKAG
jgi:peptidoglycan hydrolase FlgJ